MRKALRVDDDVGIGVAAHLPAIVDVDVNISRVFHARLHDGVGHALDQVLADVAGELVPRVPSHGRGEGKIGGRRSLFLRKQAGAEDVMTESEAQNDQRKNEAV